MPIETNRKTPAFTSDEQRWTAVANRDPAADGVFLFAVATTGIYCRPSCPARRPRRINVSFYATCAEAEHASFRACKRCQPDQISRAQRHTEAVTTACRIIEDAQDMPDLDTLASGADMSRFHFHRLFTEIVGVTPKAYAEARRRDLMHEALADSATVTEAIYDAGFNSSGRFYATANDALGMTPTAYRRGGRGETIRFATGECWLGTILVAATERGICAISMGDDPAALLRALEDRFPDASLIGGDAAFDAHVAQVIGFVDSPAQAFDLPLDIRGTAFQQQVWQALRKIPAGTTASYAEIASQIDRPGGARAVARACAANPVAIAIPCHRVVRVDGTLSGYRWGIERKRALLDREAATAG